MTAKTSADDKVPDRMAIMELTYNEIIKLAVSSAEAQAAVKAHCMRCRHSCETNIRNCRYKGCALHKVRPFMPEPQPDVGRPENFDYEAWRMRYFDEIAELVFDADGDCHDDNRNMEKRNKILRKFIKEVRKRIETAPFE